MISKTTKKKKDKLLLNLLEGEKHKHRVAMVNEEAAWNQHEPNSNMARMFVIMLLIHVIVIGGIIIYDWMNGEEAQSTVLVNEVTPTTMPSALPVAAATGGAATQGNPIPIEECATYEWRSGDSIASVAKKLGVSEEVLIKMNMLDKGTQLEANSIIRYPKQPVVRAVGISVAGVNGELAKPAVPAESLAAAHQAMPLVAAGEQTFSFQPTLENELAPVPGTAANMPAIQESPPAAVTKTAVGDSVGQKDAPIEEELPPAVPVMEKPVAPQEEVNVAPKMQPKTEPVVENEVPKAIPVKRYSPPVIEKTAVKKVAPAPAAKPARSSSYTVKPNDTLYSIANRHGVTVKALQSANKIAKPESLRDGMKLVIPAK